MIFYLVRARLLPEKPKEHKEHQHTDESDAKNLNESLMSDDLVKIEKNAETIAYQEVFKKINSASDLLRSVEDERQYNKLKLLQFSICCAILTFQSTELSAARNDKMIIPKYGTDQSMYKMYEYKIKG
jgi:hypothetical protein